MNESWNLKKLNKNVSNKVLDKYYASCQKYGSIGGKILGAGNGGFLLVYVKKNHSFFAFKKIKKFNKIKF